MSEQRAHRRVDILPIEVVVRIPTANCVVAIKSILPDERDYPEGFRAEVRCDRNELVYKLFAYVEEPKDVLTIKSTLNEVLNSMKLVEFLLKFSPL